MKMAKSARLSGSISSGVSWCRQRISIDGSCGSSSKRSATRQPKASSPRATPNYGARLLDAVHLGENGGRFVFQQGALHRVIGLAQLPSLVLEAEVAQIFVGRLFA